MEYWKNRYSTHIETATATMNMLLEFLETHGYVVESRPNHNGKFARVMDVSPLFNSLVLCDKDDSDKTKLAEPILYLCDGHSVSCALASRFFPLVCLVGVPAFESTDYQDRLLMDACKQLAVVRTPYATHCLEKLRGDALDCLFSAHAFGEALGRISDGPNAYQKLIDIAETYFGCFMNITDANYHLLAHTQHIEPQDEINAALVSMGYHSEAYLSRQRSTGYLLESLAGQAGIRVYPPEPPFPYGLVTSVMRIDGQYAGHILMACEMDQITPGTIDSFSLFVSHCERLTRQRFNILSLRDSSSQTLVLRLVAEKDLDDIFKSPLAVSRSLTRR